MTCTRTHRIAALQCLVVMAALGAPGSARAEPGDPPSCRFLCAPDVAVEPTLSIGNLFAPPRLAPLGGGEPRTASREADFELVVAVGIDTAVPRVGLTLEGIVPLFGGDDNAPELELELNFMLLTAEQTGGWAEAHLDLVDQLSPRERPGSGAAYTHKLDIELDVGVMPFRSLSTPLLRSIELEASLDYLVTGRPRAGDVVDGEELLDDASGWSLSLLIVIPIAPWEP